MIVTRAAKDWLALLRQHRKAAAPAFAAGLLLFLGVAALWPKHYRATALLSVNPLYLPQSGPATQYPAAQTPYLPAADVPSQSVTALLQQKTSRLDWQAMVSSLHLYPKAVAGGGLPQAAKRLASEVSIRQIADPKSGDPAVRIDYPASDRRVALTVVEAVAAGIAKSASAPAASSLPVNSDSTPLYAPVVLPTAPMAARQKSARPRQAAKRQAAKRQPQAAIFDAALDRRLQASLAEGADLQQAFDQNAQSLSQLHQELAKEQAKQAAPASAAAVPRPVEDPQLARLRQQLTQQQHTLADLRARYTEQYPDVVAARDHIRDTQTDISRIAAAHTLPQQPAARPERHAADPQLVAGLINQINQADTARDTLRQALQINQDQTTRIHTQIDLQKKNAAEAAALSAAAPAQPNPATSPTAAASGSQPDAAQAASTSPAPALSASQGDAGQPSAANSGDDLSTVSPAAGSPAPATGPLSATGPFLVAGRPSAVASPFFFAYPLSLVFGLVLGFLAALGAAWLSERRDPSIRNERMLRRVLPNSAVYLGGIPRIRHEVVVD